MNSTTNGRRSPREEVIEALLAYGLSPDEAKDEIALREAAAQRMLDEADAEHKTSVAKQARAHLFAKTPLHIIPANGHSTTEPTASETAAVERRPVDTAAPSAQPARQPATTPESPTDPESDAKPEAKAPIAATPRRLRSAEVAETLARPRRQSRAPAEVLEEVKQEATDYSVEAIELVKTYATDNLEVQALKGVSLAVPRGDMVAIMGPSGCGKTTLLNCLSGLDTVDGGLVRVDGVDLAQLSDDAKSTYRARSMGFVFQFYNLLPVLNAVENVELPLLVSGVQAKQAREMSLHALDLVKLSDWAAHRPAQLSGGQRQRVTIARALVNSPAIVWADEPTGDLDSKNADEIMDLILGLNRDNGQTFVIVTHDIRVAEKTFRIINMLDGEIVSETVTDSGRARAAAVGAK